MLDGCGRHYIHRAIDTTGYSDRATVKAVAQRAELFLFDLKLIDPERHKKYTGVSSLKILENLTFLDTLGADITIRIPLIPGINDDHENLSQICRFLSKLSGIHKVHILPYHDHQKNKYNKLGLHYHAEDMVLPTRSQLTAVAKRFEDMGYQINIGG